MDRRKFLKAAGLAPLAATGCPALPASRQVDLWGDSHLAADQLGYGAGHLLAQEDNNNTSFSITANRAWIGSIVRDWVGAFNTQRTASTVVVSSGTNEAFQLHHNPGLDILNYWGCVEAVARARGARVVWLAPHEQGLLSLVPAVKTVLAKLGSLDPGVVTVVTPRVGAEHIAADGFHYNTAGKQIIVNQLVAEVTR